MTDELKPWSIEGGETGPYTIRDWDGEVQCVCRDGRAAASAVCRCLEAMRGTRAEVERLREQLAGQKEVQRAEKEEAFSRGVGEGRCTQAILELQGRDKFLASVKLDLQAEVERLQAELVERNAANRALCQQIDRERDEFLRLRAEREKSRLESADHRFHIEQLKAEVEGLRAQLTDARKAIKVMIGRATSVPWQRVLEADVDSFVEFMREKIAQTGKDGGA